MRIEHKVIIEIVIASETKQSRFLHRDCHAPILSGLAMTEKY
ncbi:MAG: hypothetical protein DDT19_02676 [Syntrophomonadaceae bacterium]|nr:hypothetical protein [Bacillota bacterium]